MAHLKFQLLGISDGAAPQVGQACIELVPVRAFNTLPSISVK